MAEREKPSINPELGLLHDTTLGASGLIHEISQPLLGIKAGIELLEKKLGAQVSEHGEWQMLSSQVSRLEEILRTFRALLSADSVHPLQFNVGEVVDRAVFLMQHRLRTLGDRFSLSHAETGMQGPLTAWGIPAGVLHAITNLLVNAIDASCDAGRRGRIALRVISGQQLQNQVLIRISDDGGGIPQGLREKIFQPRFSTKDSSGLGLYLSHRILKAAGADLQMVDTTDPDRLDWASTEFSIALPKTHRDEAAVRLADKPSRTQQPPEALGQSGGNSNSADRRALPTAHIESPKTVQRGAEKTSPNPARILVVDDEEVILMILRTALSQNGHQVDTANDPSHALKLLKTQNYDLLVTDKNMPGMDGVELAYKARAMRPQIGIVLITGYASQQSAQALLRLGIDNYVTKPFRIDDVVKTLESVLLQHQQQIAALAPSQTKPAPNSTTDKILVCVEEPREQASLAEALSHQGWTPEIVSPPCWEMLKTLPCSGGVLDQSLCGKTTKDRLLDIRKTNPSFKLIVLADQASLSATVSSILMGATGQIVRPLLKLVDIEAQLQEILVPTQAKSPSQPSPSGAARRS